MEIFDDDMSDQDLATKYGFLLKDKEFSEKYHQIINQLGFSEKEDRISRDLLHTIMIKKQGYKIVEILQWLESVIKKSKEIVIFGGGPGASKFFDDLQSGRTKIKVPQKDQLIVAIDGATELLYRNYIIPNIIFTDLDGITLETMQKLQSDPLCLVIIHAHGDNQDKIKKFKSFINIHKQLIATTQVESKSPVINLGGFTDGDRALFFLNNFLEQQHKVILIGYEFGSIVGKHSKPSYTDNVKADPMKSKKIKFGKELTEYIINNSKADIVTVDMGYPIALKCKVI